MVDVSLTGWLPHNSLLSAFIRFQLLTNAYKYLNKDNFICEVRFCKQAPSATKNRWFLKIRNLSRCQVVAGPGCALLASMPSQHFPQNVYGYENCTNSLYDKKAKNI